MKKKLKVYILERRGDIGSIFGDKGGWALTTDSGSLVETYSGCSKSSSINFAAGKMKSFLAVGLQHSELRIRNKNGTFSPARTYPRSADPKRSKG